MFRFVPFRFESPSPQFCFVLKTNMICAGTGYAKRIDVSPGNGSVDFRISLV